MSDDRLEEHIAEFTAPVASLQMTKRMQALIRDLAVAAWRFDWQGHPGTTLGVEDNEGIPRLLITIPDGSDGPAVRLEADVSVSVPAQEQIRDLIWEHVRRQVAASLTFGSDRPAAAAATKQPG
jgi:hypothetical protein